MGDTIQALGLSEDLKGEMTLRTLLCMGSERLGEQCAAAISCKLDNIPSGSITRVGFYKLCDSLPLKKASVLSG